MRTDGTRGLRRLGTDIGATRGGQRMMGGALSNRMRNTVPGMRQVGNIVLLDILLSSICATEYVIVHFDAHYNFRFLVLRVLCQSKFQRSRGILLQFVGEES